MERIISNPPGKLSLDRFRQAREKKLRYGITIQDRDPSLLTVFQLVVYGSVILYFGRTVFIPLAFAALISFVLYPVCKWLEKNGIGKIWAILMSVLAVTIFMVFLSILLASQVLAFLEEWPAFKGKVLNTLASFNQWLIAVFSVSAEQTDTWFSRAADQGFIEIFSVLRSVLTGSAFSAVLVILIPVYSVMILYYRKNLVEVLCRLFPNERKESIHEALILTIRTYYNFIKGMGVVYLVVGILNSIGLLILGVPHAILFGFIASILTFIPYVGILAGSLLPVTMSWVAYDSIWYPLGVIGIFTIVQYLEANVIFPIAVSNRLNVNTMAVLVSIFVGGILWGVAGMILFVPFVGILKLVADHNNFKTISLLLGIHNNEQ